MKDVIIFYTISSVMYLKAVIFYIFTTIACDYKKNGVCPSSNHRLLLLENIW